MLIAPVTNRWNRHDNTDGRGSQDCTLTRDSNNSNIINTFLPTHSLGYLYNNFKLNNYGAELTSLLAFPYTSLSWLFSASITKLSQITGLYNNSVSHLNGSSDLCCLTLVFITLMKHGRSLSATLCGRLITLCFDARLADASGSAATRFWSIWFMRFRMCCNWKAAPNIGEVSFVLASRWSRAPQTSGPYPSPPPPLATSLPSNPEQSLLGLSTLYIIYQTSENKGQIHLTLLYKSTSCNGCYRYFIKCFSMSPNKYNFWLVLPKALLYSSQRTKRVWWCRHS